MQRVAVNFGAIQTLELSFLYLGFSVFLQKKSGLFFKSSVATLEWGQFILHDLT